ncbi:MAG: Crp/Fnr family transcriptional regulator [Clostridiales bacterium]|jgi:CRP/FNR family transcriptional regulator|nr:Crp/Fnr family transcriptional regulator [Clostridiales bacterium]
MFDAKEIPFYNHLTQGEIELLKSGLYQKKFVKGQLAHSSTEPCLGVIIVRKGKLRAYLISDQGKEITLYYLSSGDTCVLSASCILDSISFEVLVEAVEDTEVMQITASCFNQVMKTNVMVENFALKLAAEKFSDVMWVMQQILFFSMDKRLAMYLYQEMIDTKSATLYITHENIAKSLGTAREVVTRLLRQFAQDEVVEVTRGKVTVIDRNKLQAMFN